ncbi:MAG: ATP-binding protein [Desulfobacterales bacterium]
MPKDLPLSTINIAMVGGDDFCREVLGKLTHEYKRDVNARIVALAHEEAEAPGRRFAESIGIKTFDDYHDLYDSKLEIDLIAILRPSQEILDDILTTKPPRIRLLSYQTFKLFWDGISARTKEIETVWNSIQQNILVITPDRTIVDVNDSFLKQMNYAREEVIGKKCHEVFQQKNHICSNQYCPLKDTIDRKAPGHNVIPRLGSDGEIRYIEVTVYPIWEKPGKISRFVEISRDITERKKEEEQITRRLEAMVEERTIELKKTHEKLLHQDKMASLGKLSASVVHEINNPVAGILNLTLLIKRILKEDGSDLKEVPMLFKYLDLMETETRRISRIVSNLLSFSRHTKMDLTELNINQLVEKALLLNNNLMKLNQIQVDQRLEPGLPMISGSEDQLLQVFMNIISNSAEAMTTSKDRWLTVETKYNRNSNEIELLFADTGIGIPNGNLTKIYEPFFTTKKKGKGVGLGLSVAYGIIKEHNGSIKVSSTLGEGTQFTFSLPV